MKKVLVIKSSLNGEQGNSNKLTDEFLIKLQKTTDFTVTERDLSVERIPHLSQEEMGAWMASPDERTPEQIELAALSQALIDELQAHDTIVVAMPMYNFGVPSNFKAWVDRVARAGITFKYTETGPVGLLDNKDVVIVAARGGMYAGTEKDSQSQYLKDFFSFIGLSDIRFIYAEGLNMPEKEQRLVKASEQMTKVAAELAA
ncbi:FMN-dependent NADH-azoreductase [Thalassotalea ganghwensis]